MNGVSTRRRNLAEKGRAYRATVLKERREKIKGRMMRKCGVIEDFLFSKKSRIAVEKELAQFNDLFKMLLSIHEEYSQVLDDEERADEDDWFDDLGNTVCNFKRKIHRWLRSAEKLKGSHQRDSQRAVNQGKTSHQKAQESLSLSLQET